MLIRRVSMVVGALLLTTAPAMAQDHAGHDKTTPMKGAPIALEGCVLPGENRGTFVITSMKEIPDRPNETGLVRVYKLNKYGKFSDKGGQLVRIDGRVDGITAGEMEPKPGQAKDGTTLVELEGPGRDVDTTLAVVQQSVKGTSGKVKVKTTVIKVDVDTVTAVRACGS